MAARVRLALVGCGAIAEMHLYGIDQGKAPIDITAVVDVDPQRAETFAQRTGARAFVSLTEALRHGDFDAVDLMLPHHLHEELTLQALAAGKHVLLEKPMAPTVAACERILSAARASGKVFMVAENAQYWPEVVVARQLLDSGEIGELVTATASIFFPPLPNFYGGDRPWRLDSHIAGGGIAIDTGSHWIRPLRLWLGEIDAVVAHLGHPYTAMQGESLVHALCRGRGGAVATFHALLTAAPLAPGPHFRITGTRGEIVIDQAGALTLFNQTHRRGSTIGQPEGYLNSYRGEFLDFAAAVLEGKPLAAEAAFAVGELRVALAMYRSAASGSWEAVWDEAGT